MNSTVNFSAVPGCLGFEEDKLYRLWHIENFSFVSYIFLFTKLAKEKAKGYYISLALSPLKLLVSVLVCGRFNCCTFWHCILNIVSDIFFSVCPFLIGASCINPWKELHRRPTNEIFSVLPVKNLDNKEYSIVICKYWSQNSNTNISLNFIILQVTKVFIYPFFLSLQWENVFIQNLSKMKNKLI